MQIGAARVSYKEEEEEEVEYRSLELLTMNMREYVMDNWQCTADPNSVLSFSLLYPIYVLNMDYGSVHAISVLIL